MHKNQTSYRQIMKATTLFGGVQFIQIFISIIRSKFVAVLLGPTGMGIVGLLTSTTGLISGLTNFGIGTSAIKNISEANATNNENRVSVTVGVVRKLVWFTGVLGAVIMLIFSKSLSLMTFGNTDFKWSFVWLSITLLLNELTAGEAVLMQGLRKLKDLARANLYSSFMGLIIAIPIYYKFGIDGIVPVIIITYFLTFYFAWSLSKKTKIKKVNIPFHIVRKEGKEIMTMGFMISLSGLISLLVSYLVRIFITRMGSVEDVGFYTAGFTIINTYVSMIFTAMGTDYYPRLSAIAKNNSKCRKSINQQSEIILLILAPILIFFLVFINIAVLVVYSREFLVITHMVYWAVLGVFFKAISWAITFIFLAKGESKLYFWIELTSSSYELAFNILGYYWGGLTGLGISFLATFIVYLIQVFLIAKMKYKFAFTKSFIRIFRVQFLLATTCFVLVLLFRQPYIYLFGIPLIIISSWFSIKELEQRIGLRSIYNDIKRQWKERKRNSDK